MKASELAIGDWVCVAGPVINREERLTPPMRVVSIGDTWINLMIDPEQGDPFEEDIEDIRPIPLTHDIMYKNFKEWQKRSNHYWVGWSNSNERSITHELFIEWRYPRWVFTLHEYTYPSNNITVTVHYVHELQHTLLLAGIDKDIKL